VPASGISVLSREIHLAMFETPSSLVPGVGVGTCQSYSTT
jgi:hypothetical protein